MARSFQAGIRWKLGTTPIAVRIPSASCLPYRNCQSRAMRCGSRNKKAWKWRFLLDFQPVEGTIELTGRDLTARLIDANTSEHFADQTASQIATLLAQRRDLMP